MRDGCVRRLTRSEFSSKQVRVSAIVCGDEKLALLAKSTTKISKAEYGQDVHRLEWIIQHHEA